MTAHVIAAVAGAVAIGAFVLATVRSSPLRGGVITDGTIVAVDERDSATPQGFSRTFTPTVEFRDSTGTTHTVTASMGTGWRPTVGSTMRVSYLQANPNRARVVANARTRIGSLVILGVGIAFLVVAFR